MLHLKTNQLTVGYRQKKVVENINIDAWKGQVICVLGPNGSGKTTILRSIAGLIAPIKGTVFLKGAELTSFSRQKLAEEMAVVLTDSISSEYMRACDFIAAGRYPHTGFLGKLSTYDTRKINEAIYWVNAESITDKYFNELSDGERQKVLLARALAQDTELIILDEPTSYLDLKHRAELISLLNRLSKEKGKTIILSLHDVELALKVCEILVLVNKGQIVDFGPVDKIIREDTINQLYGLKKMNYNNQLGSIELTCPQSQASIFVVGGAGFGTPVYRMLAKQGFGFTTGIIHQNDLDFQVAQTIQAHVIAEKPFETINDHTFAEAEKAVRNTAWIVDTGFPVGHDNQRNMELILSAVKLEKKVFSLRSEAESRQRLGEMSMNINFFLDINDLIHSIKKNIEL